MRQAPKELGKIQWAALAALSDIDNLPAKSATKLIRPALFGILKWVDEINDSHNRIKDTGVEGIGRDECLILDYQPAHIADAEGLRCPSADRSTFDSNLNSSQDEAILKSEKGVGLQEGACTTHSRNDVVSLFDSRLDRFFRS